MKIPEGYRELVNGDRVLITDFLQESEDGMISPVRPGSTDVGNKIDKINFPHHGKFYHYLRKIDSPWISVKERLPKKEDLDGMGCVLCRDQFGAVTQGQPTGSNNFMSAVYWMVNPALPEPVIPTITIQEGGSTREHELIFNKDGSIKAGCVTIDNETMDKIICRRMEAKS